jgi:hypothetical protein
MKRAAVGTSLTQSMKLHTSHKVTLIAALGGAAIALVAGAMMRMRRRAADDGEARAQQAAKASLPKAPGFNNPTAFHDPAHHTVRKIPLHRFPVRRTYPHSGDR